MKKENILFIIYILTYNYQQMKRSILYTKKLKPSFQIKNLIINHSIKFFIYQKFNNAILYF